MWTEIGIFSKNIDDNKRLVLRNNEVTSVHVDSFKNLQGVEQLYLNDNKLKRIDATTLDPLRKT